MDLPSQEASHRGAVPGPGAGVWSTTLVPGPQLHAYGYASEVAVWSAIQRRVPVSGVVSRAVPRRVSRGANRKVSGVSCEGNGTHPNFWRCRNYGKEGPGRGVGHPSADRDRVLRLEDSSKKSPRSAHASGIYAAAWIRARARSIQHRQVVGAQPWVLLAQDGLTTQHEASIVPSVV